MWYSCRTPRRPGHIPSAATASAWHRKRRPSGRPGGAGKIDCNRRDRWHIRRMRRALNRDEAIARSAAPRFQGMHPRMGYVTQKSKDKMWGGRGGSRTCDVSCVTASSPASGRSEPSAAIPWRTLRWSPCVSMPALAASTAGKAGARELTASTAVCKSRRPAKTPSSAKWRATRTQPRLKAAHPKRRRAHKPDCACEAKSRKCDSQFPLSDGTRLWRRPSPAFAFSGRMRDAHLGTHARPSGDTHL